MLLQTPEEEGSMNLRNVRNRQPSDTASHPTRKQSSATSQWNLETRTSSLFRSLKTSTTTQSPCFVTRTYPNGRYVQILTLQKPHIPASFNMYLVINKCVTAVKVSNFSGHYLRNRSTLDIGVLGYIGIL